MSTGHLKVDYALAYARRGWRVFPCYEMRGDRCSCRDPKCASPAKHPRIKGWQRLATTDEAQIRKWWTTWPNANVGVACGKESDLLVLDVDGEAGLASLFGLLEQGYELPMTPEVATGSGGSHVYLRHIEGLSNAVRFAPGLDIRTQGGFVVGAGSRNAKGEYRFREGRRPGDVEIQPSPQWLIDLVKEHSSQNGAITKPFSLGTEPIAEGLRNDTLYRFGRSLHARGFGFDEIDAALRVVNERRCVPPVSPDELAQIARNASTQADRPDFAQPNPEAVRLAALPVFEYEKIRKPEAKRLGVRVNVLDAEVEKLRPRAPADEGEPLAPPPPEPWPEPVEACTVLDELRAFMRRFVIVDSHALTAIVLWAAFAHAFEIAETSPRLAILSPTKRCGKSRLIELLILLCPRALSASNLSVSAIFRTIDAAAPTLLIDEADTLGAHERDDLRGILNSGHTRASAFVIRSVPVGEKQWVPKRFSTWCAIVMAAIGKLVDTWADRSITISMKRKPPREKVERLIRRNVAAREQAATLARKLARVAADNLDALREANPFIPEALNDRAADNFEHLFAIAELAGGEWPELARAAAVALSGDGAAESDSLERLLHDVRETFSARQADRLSSKALCEGLCSIEGASWAEFGRSRKPLSPSRLARLLAPFTIASHTIRLQDGTAKGYLLGDFGDAFDRYLSIPPVSGGNSVTTAAAQGAEASFQSVTDEPGDVSKNGTKPTPAGACDVVTGENREDGDEPRNSVEEAEIDRLAEADADNGERGEIEHPNPSAVAKKKG